MKCQLGEEYIFGVKKSQSNSSTAKCTVLSVGYGADPGLHIGTALQNKLNNISDPKGSAGNRRLAFLGQLEMYQIVMQMIGLVIMDVILLDGIAL